MFSGVPYETRIRSCVAFFIFRLLYSRLYIRLGFCQKKALLDHLGNATIYKSARERVLASSAEELAKNNTSQHSWRVAMVPPDRSRAACAPFRRDVPRRQSALCRRRRCTTTCIAPRRFQSMREKRRSSRGGRRTRRRKRSHQNDEENNNTARSRATR